MTESDEKTNSAEGVWRKCLAQAQSFISAAERLAEDDDFAHIVHHLSLLALEEIGKGGMLASHAVTGHDRSSLDKALGSHVRKLQWALWTPMKRISPKDFAEAMAMAKEMHDLRLSSLYVDPNSDQSEPAAMTTVSPKRARAWLNVARARLKVEESHGIPSGEPDELLDWFLDTMAGDDIAKKYLLSKEFTDKYQEMGGDTREWAQWALAEIEKFEQESAEILKVELARKAKPGAEHKPRWRAKATVHTPSHSIRAKVLNLWNERLGEAIEFVYTGKKDKFDLRLTLHDNTGISDILPRATHLAKLSVACLNLGSIGYFWFQRPGFEQQLFRDVEDLEKTGMTLQIHKPKPSFWGDNRAVALTELHITNALSCMMAFMPMTSDEAAPIFMPYFNGLALLAKSDEFFSFDQIAHREFGACLGEALNRFAGWDGAKETFELVFHKAFEPFMPEKSHRDEMLKALVPKEGDPKIEPWEMLRAAKHAADLYLVYVANQKFQERFEELRRSAS